MNLERTAPYRPPERRRDTIDAGTTERIETLIVGGGQIGLATGYHLTRHDRSFVILDEQPRVGDAWRTRWDSLRLFTPARYDGLPDWRFPAPPWSFPTKDEMADYLEAYALRFDLPVRTSVHVEHLSRDGDRFLVRTSDGLLEAENVVVASGAHHIPKIPPFAAELRPSILQLHSKQYRSPSQIEPGRVLLVGAGNSGAEIAFELSRTHRTWLAGRDIGQIPVRHGSVPGRYGFSVLRFVGHHVLTTRNPIGRRLRPRIWMKGDPLIRVRRKDLSAAGVERVPRVVGVRGGLPMLEDERVVDPSTVIWCTGFRTDFAWIDLPILDENGEPRHVRGVVASEPGLYFVGLVFLFSLSSDVLPDRGRDAAYIAKHIACRPSRRLAVRSTVALPESP